MLTKTMGDISNLGSSPPRHLVPYGTYNCHRHVPADGVELITSSFHELPVYIVKYDQIRVEQMSSFSLAIAIANSQLHSDCNFDTRVQQCADLL